MDKILLIDIRLWMFMEYHRGSNLLNVLEALSNIPVRGFKHIFFVYDTGKSKYHKNLYQNYKENRTELREKQTDQEKQKYKEFSNVYKEFYKITEFFGKNIRIPQTEADTMIEVLANEYSKRYEVYICSSDGDFMCMLDNPNIKQITTRYELLDGIAVQEKKGVTPKQLFWAKCLCGDTKDNVLGIHKLGEVKSTKDGKVFKKYLEQHSDDLDSLLKALDVDVTKGIRGMALPDYSSQGVEGIDSVYALFKFNSELKRDFSKQDLTQEDLGLLKEQVAAKRRSWDEDDFMDTCFMVLGHGAVISSNTKNFFNVKG